MSKVKTALFLWKNNKRHFMVAIFNHLVEWKFFNLLPDKQFLKLIYRVHIGKRLDLENPRGFNEKLQWLKLYDRNPKYIEMVDKVDVKDLVSRKIGNEYVIPTLGVWNSFKEIDFDLLPNQFVLKCSHDSGSVCICKDKKAFDVKKAKRVLGKALSRNLFYWGREWPYKYVKPRILAESFLNDGNDDLIDYKFMCFNGEVKCIFTVTNRFVENDMHVTFYTPEWEIMPFTRHYKADTIPIPRPKSFTTMMQMAQKLSVGMCFARIDFYEVNRKPYFGEITLYPGNGIEEFEPEEWDRILGDMMKLPI